MIDIQNEIDELECAFKQEFGELSFSYKMATIPVGLYFDSDDPEKSLPLEYKIGLRGVMTLPNGKVADACAFLPLTFSPESYQQAFATITLACLRRLSRYYQDKEAV